MKDPDKIIDNLYLGAYHGTSHWLQHERDGEDIAILSVGDFVNPQWEKKFGGRPGKLKHLHLGGISDRDYKKMGKVLPEAIRFIKANSDKDQVIVHCWAGVNRSSTIVTAYLMLVKGKSFIKALSFVQSKHVEASPMDGMRKLLNTL